LVIHKFDNQVGQWHQPCNIVWKFISCRYSLINNVVVMLSH